MTLNRTRVETDGQHLPIRMCCVLFRQCCQIGGSDFIHRTLLSEVVYQEYDTSFEDIEESAFLGLDSNKSIEVEKYLPCESHSLLEGYNKLHPSDPTKCKVEASSPEYLDLPTIVMHDRV
ncbi:hypothetical protein TNCV_5081501 [Trichonephila clavipes]|nr:hypothetical protein TNCV_5081501 [Trichonephila clavipes]